MKRPRFPTGLLPFFALALFLAGGCQTAPPPSSIATHDSSKFEGEIRAFEASDRTNPPPKGCIVFVGSSSIRKWTTLKQDFPDLAVVNRGFGGSVLADSVHFANRIIIPYGPRQVVIYAGANDIAAGEPPDAVFGDFIALVTRLHAALPQARLSYIAIAGNPARWAQLTKVVKANGLIRDYCNEHGIDFINVFPLMLGPDGKP